MISETPPVAFFEQNGLIAEIAADALGTRLTLCKSASSVERVNTEAAPVTCPLVGLRSCVKATLF